MIALRTLLAVAGGDDRRLAGLGLASRSGGARRAGCRRLRMDLPGFRAGVALDALLAPDRDPVGVVDLWVRFFLPLRGGRLRHDVSLSLARGGPDLVRAGSKLQEAVELGEVGEFYSQSNGCLFRARFGDRLQLTRSSLEEAEKGSKYGHESNTY